MSDNLNITGLGNSPTSNIQHPTSSSPYQNILTEVESGILKITINRPDKMNALNHLTIQEIGKAVEQGANDTSVVGIIITGAGDKAFVAGADISEFANYSPDERNLLPMDKKFSEALNSARSPLSQP